MLKERRILIICSEIVFMLVGTTFKVNRFTYVDLIAGVAIYTINRVFSCLMANSRFENPFIILVTIDSFYVRNFEV